MRKSTFAVTALVSAALAVSGAARADAVADFYKGRNVSVVIGFAPGGGADLFARYLARHIGKHIPGQPNVIVLNMPGAGGLNAANHVYNVAAKDGSVIATMTSTLAVDPLLGNKKARFETLGFNWLGSVTKDPPACVASNRSGIKSIEDARKREIIFGGSGPSALSSQHPTALRNIFGYRIRVVTGYTGTASIRQAVEKGEADATCAIYASQAMGQLRSDIQSGKLVPIVQMGSKKHPIFGNAPLVTDLARNDEERQIAKFVYGLAELSRPVAAPPGVPADRVAALRKAFWAMVTSPEAKADAEKLRIIVDPMNADATVAIFHEVLKTPKSIIDRSFAAMRK